MSKQETARALPSGAMRRDGNDVGRHHRRKTLRKAATALLLATSAGCGGYSEEQMQAKLARIQDLQLQLADADDRQEQQRDDLAQLKSENGQLRARLAALGEDVGTLQSSLAETQVALEQLRAREKQQQERLATFKQLLTRFKSMIDDGRLRLRIVRNRMVIELPDNVLFDSGKAELKEAGRLALQEVAGVLKSIEGREYQVAGHTDNVPIRSRRFPSNWHLSTARGVTVARFLMEQGLRADRLSAAGYADTQPVASNEVDSGRAQNRRIEIALVPKLDELPDLSSLAQADESAEAKPNAGQSKADKASE